MKSKLFVLAVLFTILSSLLLLPVEAKAEVTGNDLDTISGSHMVSTKTGAVSKIEMIRYSSDWKTATRVPIVVPGSPITNFPGAKIGGVWAFKAGPVFNDSSRKYESGGAFGCWTDKVGNGICTTIPGTTGTTGTTKLVIREGTSVYSGSPLVVTNLKFWGDFGEIIMDQPIPVAVTVPPSTTPTRVLGVVTTGNMLVWGRCGTAKNGASPCLVFYHRATGKLILFLHGTMSIFPGTRNALSEVPWGGDIRGGRATKTVPVYNAATGTKMDVIATMTTDGRAIQRVFIPIP